MPPIVPALTTALVSSGVSAAVAATIATAVGRLVVGATISLVSASLTRRATPGREELKRELSTPTERPPYRYVYGETRAIGSLVAWPVKGKILWGCWLLNSRVSDMSNLGLILDEREVTHTGDPFDFADLDGATATKSPFRGHVNFWVQRGDETSPPQRFLNDCAYDEEDFPEGYKTTDGWQGRTVLWMRLSAGGNRSRADRWPATPPQVQVDAKWSKIYDPRNAAHDIDDPDTWEPSDNQGLILLDVLLNNPVRPYQVLNLNMDSYKWAADVADESVALKAGGTEKRYRAAGTIVFSEGVELEDMLEPVLIAGASKMTRIGGKLAVIPATTKASVGTISTVIDNLKVDWLRPSKELPTRILGNYVNVNRGYENADLPYYEIPGAQAADGGVPKTRSLTMSMVESPSQAQRLVKIFGYDARRQRKITTTLPPENINLISGSEATVSFPADYDAINGTYEVIQITPQIDVTDDGVTLRSQAELLIVDDTGLAWDAATEERDINDEGFDVSTAPIGDPGAISVTIMNFDTGGTVVPGAEFKFDPSSSASVSLYEWQYEVDSGNWQTGGTIDASTVDAEGNVYGILNLISTTSLYRIRVRAIATYYRTSGWTTSSSFAVAFDLTITSATGGIGHVNVVGNTPAASNFDGIRVYRGSDFASATLVASKLSMAPGSAFDEDFGDPSATNEVTNGDFSASGGWSTEAGWSISGGQASHVSGSTGYLRQTLTGIEDGADYRLTFTVTSINASSTRGQLLGSTTVSGTDRSTTGTFSETLTAPASTTSLRFNGWPNVDLTLDSIYLVKDTAGMLPVGQSDYWFVPVTKTGTEGTEQGPYTLRVY